LPEAALSIDLNKLRCADAVNIDRAYKSIGTLGGGNHFIELDCGSTGEVYLVIHTGSRNLGKQIADYHQKLAILDVRCPSTAMQDIILEYKKAGREREIQSALKGLSSKSISDDLCYLSGEHMSDYLHDMDIAQRFAMLNRRFIADRILSRLGVGFITKRFETVHNYIDLKNMILRKGAVSARCGEKLIIPLNMRDGSLLCVGKGNPDWNWSAPHGAGRIMSRSQARKIIQMRDFTDSMRGIYSTSVNESTIDESPMAYKPMDEIIGNISETVSIIGQIKPIYNFKASDLTD
jgi:RNA-splicing ligase RtcB